MPSLPYTVTRGLGIARSLLMYYGPFWRCRRLTSFYGQFLSPGDLAFDIGAHVGNRIRIFRRLGARVVAVEPQPDFVRVLRLIYGRDGGVCVDAHGVAAKPGSAQLHLSTRTPTVSSFADAWIHDVTAAESFRRVSWDRSMTVPLTSLDELVAQHGEPQFCKIDVEGFEREVLDGLSRPLAALSFEYIPVTIERAIGCVERMSALGDYRFRRSPVETHRWAEPSWLEAEAMIMTLRGLTTVRSGDVYAVRADRVAALR